MKNFKKISLSLAVATALSFSGCGSSSSDDTTNNDDDTSSNSTVSGKVADGYLDKAKVCLDKNENGKCDTDEPNTLSVNGDYSLSVTTTDVGKYPILVEVTTATVDLDDNQTVTNGYTLSAPKDSTGFISPITTLIQNEIEKYPVLTKDDALKRVSDKLNITSTQSKLLTDYVANGSDSESFKLHEVGKVVATLQGALELKLTQSTVMTDDNKKASNNQILNSIYKDINNSSALIKTGTLASAIDTTTKVTDTNITSEDITTSLKILALTKNATLSIPKDLLELGMYMFDDESESRLRYQKLNVSENKVYSKSVALNNTTDYVVSQAQPSMDITVNDGKVIITNEGNDDESYISDYGNNYKIQHEMNAIVSLNLGEQTYTLKEILNVYRKTSSNFGTETLISDLTTAFPDIATKYDTALNFTDDDKMLMMKTYQTVEADGYTKATTFGTSVFFNKSAMDKILNILQN